MYILWILPYLHDTLRLFAETDQRHKTLEKKKAKKKRVSRSEIYCDKPRNFASVALFSMYKSPWLLGMFDRLRHNFGIGRIICDGPVTYRKCVLNLFVDLRFGVTDETESRRGNLYSNKIIIQASLHRFYVPLIFCIHVFGRLYFLFMRIQILYYRIQRDITNDN